MITAKISEIFTSIQGEGPYVGIPTLFVRFYGCNLDCSYCDTDPAGYEDYTAARFIKKIAGIKRDSYSMISLTGGEPLLQAAFLAEILPKIRKLRKPVYLETNATLSKSLETVYGYVDIIAADLKNEYLSDPKVLRQQIDFLRIGMKKSFIKIIITLSDTAAQMRKIAGLLKKIRCHQDVVLQPDTKNLARTYEKAWAYKNIFIRAGISVRIIPQVHRLAGVQ